MARFPAPETAQSRNHVLRYGERHLTPRRCRGRTDAPPGRASPATSPPAGPPPGSRRGVRRGRRRHRDPRPRSRDASAAPALRGPRRRLKAVHLLEIQPGPALGTDREVTPAPILQGQAGQFVVEPRELLSVRTIDVHGQPCRSLHDVLLHPGCDRSGPQSPEDQHPGCRGHFPSAFQPCPAWVQ